MANGLQNVARQTCPSGTPQDSLNWLAEESVCAQALPAWTTSSLLTRKNLPSSDYSNTAGALLFIPLSDFNVFGLRFLCRHASAIASKAATARLWLVRENDKPLRQDQYFEYEVEPLGDLAIATSGSPPIVLAADSDMGGDQTAFADSLVFTPYVSDTRHRTEGNAAGVKSTLKIDHHGARGLILAINIGTMTAIRAGVFGV